MNCSSLTSISVETNNTNYHSSNNCLITTSTSILILGCNNSIIPTDGSVTTIGKNAFYNCSELNSITISTNVTSIEERVFYGCSALTQITYSGTMAEFEEIEKEPLWNEESSIQKVICTDGDIVI